MEIPTIALPYLGRGLSPSLFEVSGALQKAESGGRLPVRIAFAGPSAGHPRGDRHRGLRAAPSSGYLTAASGPPRSAPRCCVSTSPTTPAAGTASDGLFGHGVSIGLPGASGPARTRPAVQDAHAHHHRPQPPGQAGPPATMCSSASADNPRALSAGLAETDNFFFHGTAKFSVPAGHYWAMATFLNFTRDRRGRCDWWCCRSSR